MELDPDVFFKEFFEVSSIDVHNDGRDGVQVRINFVMPMKIDKYVKLAAYLKKTLGEDVVIT